MARSYLFLYLYLPTVAEDGSVRVCGISVVEKRSGVVHTAA